MISLDISLAWAVVVFLVVIFALNRLLCRPLLRIQKERASRTTGLVTRAQEQLDHHLDLFNQYQAAIKNGRMEGYRLQEQARAEALKRRTEALARAREDGERLLLETRDSIQAQVQDARQQLETEAQELARGIASTVLQRSA